MKTVVTAIQKGGQGKTMATCHLAYDFAARGHRVVVIDLDTQANASFTLEKYKSGLFSSQLFTEPGSVSAAVSVIESGLVLIEADAKLADLEKGNVAEAAQALRESISALNGHFDFCLIDTPPSLGVAMTAAMLAADFILSPVELEAYSLQGMKKMVSVIGNLRKMNPKLRFLGMLPNRVDARKPRHKANLAALRKAYPQLVMPVSVGERDSIADALGEQKPVWEMKKTAARKATHEVRAFAQFVYEKMEISQ